MKISLKTFFQDIYINTKGFIPVFPLDISLDIGDYFLIEDGQFIKLGGLQGNEEFFDLEEPVKISEVYTQPRKKWQTEDRINTTYKSRGAALEWDNLYLSDLQQALIVEFRGKGSYYFRCSEVMTRRFENFNELSDQILGKFVSKEFNYKEIYIVTEVATPERYAITVAESNGNITIDFDQEGYYELDDLVDPEVTFRPHQSRNIAYNSMNRRSCDFIRAEKIDISYEGKHHVSRHIRQHLPENMQLYYHNLLNYAKTNVLQLTNVFPGNAVDYYSFFPAGLEDIEKLFATEN